MRTVFNGKAREEGAAVAALAPKLDVNTVGTRRRRRNAPAHQYTFMPSKINVSSKTIYPLADVFQQILSSCERAMAFSPRELQQKPLDLLVKGK